jgi:hypothetical protein
VAKVTQVVMASITDHSLLAAAAAEQVPLVVLVL